MAEDNRSTTIASIRDFVTKLNSNNETFNSMFFESLDKKLDNLGDIKKSCIIQNFIYDIYYIISASSRYAFDNIDDKTVLLLGSIFNEKFLNENELPHINEINNLQLVKIKYHMALYTCDNYNKIKTTSESSIEEMQKIFKSVQDLAKDMGVSGFSKHYHEISENEKNAKTKWFYSTIAVFIILALFLTYSVYDSIYSATFDYKQLFLRVFISSTLLAALIWTGKWYSFSRRQEIIYRHLSSSITTYQLINASIPNKFPEMSVALLLELSRNVLPIPDLKDGADIQVPYIQLIELLQQNLKVK